MNLHTQHALTKEAMTGDFQIFIAIHNVLFSQAAWIKDYII